MSELSPCRYNNPTHNPLTECSKSHSITGKNTQDKSHKNTVRQQIDIILYTWQGDAQENNDVALHKPRQLE